MSPPMFDDKGQLLCAAKNMTDAMELLFWKLENGKIIRRSDHDLELGGEDGEVEKG